MFQFHFLKIGAWFTFTFVFVGSPHALTLIEAYEWALIRDPSFQSATKDYEAGLENDSIGRANLLPKLFANYSKASNRSNITGQQQINGVPVGPYQYNANYPSDSAALQITQPLFNLDALARFQQGKAQASLSRSKYRYLTLDLSFRVLQAYTDLLYAMDHERFQDAEYKAFEEQAKLNKRNFEKGEAAQIDFLQSESAALTAKAKLVEAGDEVENTKRMLESMIGQPINLKQISKLRNNFQFLPIEPASFEVWKDKALQNNAELLAMKDQVEIANQEYKKNVAAHYPVVNLVAAATTATSSTTVTINQKANTTYAGVQVNLPLYGGGEIQSRSNQAYANYQKAQADYEVVKERVITDMFKQYNTMQSGKLKIEALTSAQNSAKKLVEAMQRSVKVGEKINLDVLTADKALYNTSRDLSQAKYQYLIGYLKLYQASGLFELDDYQKISAYFH